MQTIHVSVFLLGMIFSISHTKTDSFVCARVIGKHFQTHQMILVCPLLFFISFFSVGFFHSQPPSMIGKINMILICTCHLVFRLFCSPFFITHHLIAETLFLFIVRMKLNQLSSSRACCFAWHSTNATAQRIAAAVAALCVFTTIQKQLNDMFAVNYSTPALCSSFSWGKIRSTAGGPLAYLVQIRCTVYSVHTLHNDGFTIKSL